MDSMETKLTHLEFTLTWEEEVQQVPILSFPLPVTIVLVHQACFPTFLKLASLATFLRGKA